MKESDKPFPRLNDLAEIRCLILVIRVLSVAMPPLSHCWASASSYFSVDASQRDRRTYKRHVSALLTLFTHLPRALILGSSFPRKSKRSLIWGMRTPCKEYTLRLLGTC